MNVRQTPDRQPRGHRLPHPAYAACPGRERRGRLLRGRRRQPAPAAGRRSPQPGRRPGRQHLSGGGQDPRHCPADRRQGDPPRLWLSLRERRLCRSLRSRRHRLRRPDARAAAGVRPQAHRPRPGQAARRTDARRHRAARQPRRCPRRSRAGGLPGNAEKHRRRRRHRHARMPQCRGAVRGLRGGQAPGAEQLQRFGRVHREIHRARPPPGGAGVRRRRWRSHRPRRARLLGAAAQPEGAGGNPGARPAGRHGRGTLRGGDHPGQGGQLPQRRHRRVRLRRRSPALLLSRGEHPSAGGARRYRAGLGRRSGALDDRAGRRRPAAVGRAGEGSQAERPRHPGAPVRRGPGPRLPAEPRPAHRRGLPGGGRPGPAHRHLGRGRLRDPAVFRPDDR